MCHEHSHRYGVSRVTKMEGKSREVRPRHSGWGWAHQACGRQGKLPKRPAEVFAMPVGLRLFLFPAGGAWLRARRRWLSRTLTKCLDVFAVEQASRVKSCGEPAEIQKRKEKSTVCGAPQPAAGALSLHTDLPFVCGRLESAPTAGSQSPSSEACVKDVDFALSSAALFGPRHPFVQGLILSRAKALPAPSHNHRWGCHTPSAVCASVCRQRSIQRDMMLALQSADRIPIDWPSQPFLTTTPQRSRTPFH